MKYFLDTEFYEYKKKPLFGKAIDTIELISIGIVNEDIDVYIGGCDPITEDAKIVSSVYKSCREYYAICKDFDIKAAWNNEWLRDNVLLSIFQELSSCEDSFNLRTFKSLINEYGKTREQIAEEIKSFIYADSRDNGGQIILGKFIPQKINPIEFYAYYADYDWVVFCWLFGRMIDLPDGFPMYCKDLKQTSDEKNNLRIKYRCKSKSCVKELGLLPGYPKQINEHNALDDAKWNKRLYEFLNNM